MSIELTKDINWFPGHMAKSIKDLKEKNSIVDCFIVILDSRAPLSSYNEELDLIAPNKPRLFVFSKIDLSIKDYVNKMSAKFNKTTDSYVIVNLKKNSAAKIVLNELNKILKPKKEKDALKGLIKPRLRCFVIGMPNVGKSTLINLLAKQKKVKVANFAGTTRHNQWISADGIQLLDTPGILMPKLHNQENALKLIAIGLIKKEVINDLDFYYNILDVMKKNNIDKFDELGIKYFEDENEKYSQLVLLARKNNWLVKNGEPNIDKTLNFLREKILNLSNIFWDEELINKN